MRGHGSHQEPGLRGADLVGPDLVDTPLQGALRGTLTEVSLEDRLKA